MSELLTLSDLQVQTLGPCTIQSPLPHQCFTEDSERVLKSSDAAEVQAKVLAGEPLLSFEKAGPREKIYFDPRNLRAAIVTCGGLCPGLNDVIRAITNELYYMYGVRHIKGIRYGFAGLNPASGLPMEKLTPELVSDIHEDGGTFLGSSRGPQPAEVMVDTLDREDIRLLFVIGGDGTLRGAITIQEEVQRRGLRIAVVGVPKTIDNDIGLVSRTFGFETAVSASVESLRCAHMEAKGALYGIGIVKLMGRHSGFVAAHAALAQPDANFVLVPEVPFDLHGTNGLLAHLEKRMDQRGHALIVVAEGAGQNLFPDATGTDASGNKKLGDIGQLLRDEVTRYFNDLLKPCSVKYIDPSYIIRSVPANSQDGVFCGFLGQQAAHAGMAGKTGVMVGSWHDTFVHLPIQAAVANRSCLDPLGQVWLSVLESTGQPDRMVND